MFGGKDSADTPDADAKLPDGLGAHEGTETLEADGKSGGGHPTATEAPCAGHCRYRLAHCRLRKRSRVEGAASMGFENGNSNLGLLNHGWARMGTDEHG